MRRIWTIAWKDIYTTFSDRNLILTMIATPLAIATLVGLAFGKFSSGDVVIQHIPIAIVNLDKSASPQNAGQIVVAAFTAPGSAATTPQMTCDNKDQGATNANPAMLRDLTDTVILDNPDASRTGVDNGRYTAAIIIPPDFSQKIASQSGNTVGPVSVEVYANAGRA